MDVPGLEVKIEYSGRQNGRIGQIREAIRAIPNLPDYKIYVHRRGDGHPEIVEMISVRVKYTCACRKSAEKIERAIRKMKLKKVFIVLKNKRRKKEYYR